MCYLQPLKSETYTVLTITPPTSLTPEPDSEPIEHTFEQPSPEHQPLSPRQETEVPQSQDPTHPHVAEERTMTVDDLLQLVPKLITKVDSLETKLKQTKLTMGKALVKLVKNVKKMEDVLKRRHVVLPDSEDEDAEISSKQGRNLQEEEISAPTTLEAAKTLSNVAILKSKSVDKGKRYNRRKESKGKDIDTGFEDISTSFEDISTGFEEANTGGLGVSTEDWDAIRAKLEANAELTKDVLGKDLSEQDFAKRMVDLVNQRKKHFAEEELRQTTKAQLKRYGRKLRQKISKKQMIDDKYLSDTEEESCPQGNSRTDKEESVEAMNPTPLDTKSIFANWKIFQQAMLKDFTREDLIELYRLVMQKYGTNRPEDAYDRVL
ncbi:hypothetical protein Tco_0088852 [Tanacetum coccineum]